MRAVSGAMRRLRGSAFVKKAGGDATGSVPVISGISESPVPTGIGFVSPTAPTFLQRIRSRWQAVFSPRLPTPQAAQDGEWDGWNELYEVPPPTGDLDIDTANIQAALNRANQARIIWPKRTYKVRSLESERQFRTAAERLGE